MLAPSRLQPSAACKARFTGASACFMMRCAGERLSTSTEGRAMDSAPMAPSAASATWGEQRGEHLEALLWVTRGRCLLL